MLNKAKTIKEIFEEVKSFDLVITSDAPLATALNKLVESPRLGYLAMTPKQIASKFAQLYYDKIHEKYEVVLKISKLTGKPVKLIHQIVEKIYEVWMYNARLEFTEQFLSEDELSLLKYIKEIDTIETAMENFNEDFYRDSKIAVIGEELFSLLDLEVLPKRGIPAVKIEIFKEEEFNIEKTYIFPSAEQLIDNILKLVNKDNANETAIVLDSKSDHLEILKARFKDKDIKIEVKNFLSENIEIRNFISLIEISFRIGELKVSEYIPVAGEFGIITENFYNYRHYDISNYMKHFCNDENLKKLYNISENIKNFKFKDLLKELKLNFDFTYRKEFAELLELLEISESNISESNLLELKYFLKEFDIETDTEKSGVLFVNALNSAFIDRQIIIYVGLDNSWMTLFPEKDYLNKEEEEEKNLKRFQILLQQGRQRFYFVQDVTDYKEVIPCYYFLILSETAAGNFNDEFFNPVKIGIEKNSEKYSNPAKRKIKHKEESVIAVSPTSLNKFYRCPKQYYFSKLEPETDHPVFKKGTLLHEFAELYFNHPEFSKDNYEKIIGLMINQLSVFEKNNNEKYLDSEIRIGMDSVIGFIDSLQVKKTLLTEPEPRAFKDNSLMFELKKSKIYYNTENWLKNKDKTHINGKIDLQYENYIIDYKASNKRRSESEVSLQSNPEYINLMESEKFDFQAIAYITSKSREINEINFIYNFLLHNYKFQIDESQDVNNNLTLIKYVPLAFLKYIYTEEVFEIIKSDKIGEKLMGILGFENYKVILDNLNLTSSDYFKKEILDSRVIEVANTVVEQAGMNYSSFGNKKQETFNENIRKTISKYIYNLRSGKGECGLIYKDDVETFSVLIKDKLGELNEYSNSVFPFKPVFGSREICKNCDYLNICTGNKLWH